MTHHFSLGQVIGLMFAGAMVISASAIAQQKSIVPYPALPISATVYVQRDSDDGLLFHRDDCPIVSWNNYGDAAVMTIKDAKALGAHPCQSCIPLGASALPHLRIAKSKFTATYAAVKALSAATEVGVNRIRFSQLLQNFAADLSVLHDQPLSPDEMRLTKVYGGVLANYTLIGEKWDPSISSFSWLLNVANAEARKAANLYVASSAITTTK